MLYACSEDVRDRMHLILAQATLTFLRATVPTLGRSIFDTETIWTRGLALSYDTELRPEQKSRARQLTRLNMGDYKRITACAAASMSNLEALPHDRYNCIVSERDCRHALRRWRLRAWQGRILSIMRLTKAVFTFRDCVDYAARKIERHTGIRIEVTLNLQQHPMIFGSKV